MMLGDKEQTLSLLTDFPAMTNVFVVDSNIITLIEMEKTMRKFSYQVTTYREADKAIAYLTKGAHEINLVIWDFHMPKINGLEALKIIGSKLDLPVVIMSDDSRTESVMKATIHGACDYVMKPFSEQVIANLWQHIVRKRMMSKPVITQPAQSDLIPSHGLVPANNDPMTIGQDSGEHNIYMDDQVAMWTDLDLPLQSDMVESLETNSLYLDDDDLKVIYEDNREHNINKDGQNAATKPQMMYTNSTKSDQSNVVMTDGLDQDNGEPNMAKKSERKTRKPRMTWTTELHNKFLQAIDIIGGMEKAKSNSILKYMREMNIKGLTRANVSSHLQKHRINLEENRVSQLGLSNPFRPLSLLGPSNPHTALGWSTTPSSLPGSSNAHTGISPSAAYGPSSLMRGSNAHTDIGQSPAYGPSSLMGVSNAHTEIGQSHVYGSSSLLGPSSAYTARRSDMNGGDMNQIHQNQYPNGYLTTNSNQFMTSAVPSLSYSDDHYHHVLQQQNQQHQQQYQFPYQMDHVMNNNEPEKAYGDDIELIYPELPYDPNEYILKGNHFYQ